jgi:hypothetical protein
MKMYGGVNVQLHIYLLSLSDGDKLPPSCPTYPIHRSLGETQSWSGCYGRDINPKICAHQELNPDPLLIQSAT